MHNLIEDQKAVEHLQIILPFISAQWTRLAKQKTIEIEDLSKEIHAENSFANQFYENLVRQLSKNTANFDIYSKLNPRNNAGTSKNLKE